MAVVIKLTPQQYEMLAPIRREVDEIYRADPAKPGATIAQVLDDKIIVKVLGYEEAGAISDMLGGGRVPVGTVEQWKKAYR